MIYDMRGIIKIFMASVSAGCLLLSCGGHKNAPSEIKEITFTEAPKDYQIASNFKSMHMVQLETTNDCLVSEIHRIIDTDGKLYVLTKDNEIFCFDRITGKYLSRIGQVGEGPGEYLEATDMFYDENEKSICVLDRLRNSIHTYTLDGGLIGDRTFGTNKDITSAMTWAMRAEHSADGSVMIASKLIGGLEPSNDYAYTVVRSDGTAVKLDAFAPVKVDGYAVDFSKRPIAKCEDGLRFFKFINDTIFTLSSGKAVPYCKVNLGRKMPSKDIVAKMGSYSYSQLSKLNQSGYAMPLDEIYECGNLIVLMPQHYTTDGYYWIEKDTKKGIHIIASDNFDDECNRFLQGRSIIELVDSNEKELISSFCGATAIKAVQKQLSENKDLKLYDKNMRAFFEKADPEGNPCLVFYEN